MSVGSSIGLHEVKAVYNGPEGDLWELIMGHQIHIGGFQSSMDLATRAGIKGALHGVDLCCCNGAGMRFLTRFCDVGQMTGVDATEAVVERGRRRCAEEGLEQKVRFVLSDVCDNELPDASADFVWGEDAWCYVVDKAALIDEATRVVKPGGIIAFTDWVAGDVPMDSKAHERFLSFMKFPNVQSISGYKALLEQRNCEVKEAEDTGRFAPYTDLYLQMVEKQFTYDALRILNFDMGMLSAVADEMMFLGQLARDGKIAQARFIARKNH